MTNPTNRWYCRKCEDLTEHAHLHDAAHGIEGTHMTGSERYECAACRLVTRARDEGWNHFEWWFDEPRPIVLDPNDPRPIWGQKP